MQANQEQINQTHQNQPMLSQRIVLKYDKRIKTIYDKSIWKKLQSQQYLQCLIMYKQVLLSPIEKKRQKIFLKMSKSIPSRSPDQIRSHNQKMLRIHESLNGIIDKIRRKFKINDQAYNQLLQQLNIKDQIVYQKHDQKVANKKQSSIEIQDNDQNLLQFDHLSQRSCLNQFIQLDWPAIKFQQMSLFDSLGQKVQQQSNYSNQNYKHSNQNYEYSNSNQSNQSDQPNNSFEIQKSQWESYHSQ